MNKYDVIYESLQEQVNSCVLTLEDAEVINNLAYNKYVIEDGHSKNVKKRNNIKKRNIENKFKTDLNYEHEYTDKDGIKHGNIHQGDNKRVPIKIVNKKSEMWNPDGDKSSYGACYNKTNGEIIMSRKHVRLKGSNLVGSHEYSHALDDNGSYKKGEEEKTKSKSFSDKDNNRKNKIIDKRSVKKDNEHIDKLNKKNDFEKKVYSEIRDNKNKTGRGFNDHDRSVNEVRADVNALKTINSNGGNIMRKHLNEINRRNLQQKHTTNVKKLGAESYNYLNAKRRLPDIKESKKYIKSRIKKAESANENSNNPFGSIYSYDKSKKINELNEKLKGVESKEKRHQKTIQQNKKIYNQQKKLRDTKQQEKNKQELNILKNQNADRFKIASELVKKGN